VNNLPTAPHRVRPARHCVPEGRTSCRMTPYFPVIVRAHRTKGGRCLTGGAETGGAALQRRVRRGLRCNGLRTCSLVHNANRDSANRTLLTTNARIRRLRNLNSQVCNELETPSRDRPNLEANRELVTTLLFGVDGLPRVAVGNCDSPEAQPLFREGVLRPHSYAAKPHVRLCECRHLPAVSWQLKTRTTEDDKLTDVS
jgi:hypothetical protein